HRSGGPRVALPRAARELRDPPGLGGRGALARRRRQRAQRALPRAPGLGNPLRAPTGRTPPPGRGRPPPGAPGMRGRAGRGGGGEVGGCDEVKMRAGNWFVIETPGGGGYGVPLRGADLPIIRG